MSQLNLNLGRKLKQAGISQGERHANEVHSGWSEKAYGYMVDFIYCVGDPFLAEDVRNASKGLVPEPVSKRAWGAIILRAARNGLIKRVGYGQVKNAKAHQANAAIWKRV